MRRADRLFDIIQRLRVAGAPVTAGSLAETLEVAPRTVYRDIATLQARRVPIEGEAGVGYVLRKGFDLPPLMFDHEEAEAIAVGLRMLGRTGDAGLQAAARRVHAKLATVVPPEPRGRLEGKAAFVSRAGASVPPGLDLGDVRSAIHQRRKLALVYRDGAGQRTERKVWPVAIAYYVMATIIGGWCEMRRKFRHFRLDRIDGLTVLDETFEDPDGQLAAAWRALPRFGEAGDWVAAPTDPRQAARVDAEQPAEAKTARRFT